MKTFDLFPTPVNHIPNAITKPLLKKLRKVIIDAKSITNNQSNDLYHTNTNEFFEDLDEVKEVKKILLPHIEDFGEILFSDNLQWGFAGMWGNIMKKDGYQYRHNHCNSFISGVLYIDIPENCSSTRFWRPEPSNFFHFMHVNSERNNYYNNAYINFDNVEGGDLILFPSYLHHDVPISESNEDRITIAFNCLPTHINVGYYEVDFKVKEL